MAVVVVLSATALLATPAGARHNQAAGTDPLTRYDGSATKRLQKEYEDLLREKKALLEESPTAYFGEDEQKVNELADSRFHAIQDGPLPSGPEGHAEELRRKAESLYALQGWADDAGVNIDSEVSFGEAAELGDEYRAEAEELEARATAAQTSGRERDHSGTKADSEGAGEQEVRGLFNDSEERGAAPDEGVGLNVGQLTLLATLVCGGALFYLRRSGGPTGPVQALKSLLTPLMARAPEKPRQARAQPTAPPEVPVSSAQRQTHSSGTQAKGGRAQGAPEPAAVERDEGSPPDTTEPGAPSAADLESWFNAPAAQHDSIPDPDEEPPE